MPSGFQNSEMIFWLLHLLWFRNGFPDSVLPPRLSKSHAACSLPSLSLPLSAAADWRGELEAQKTEITGCDKTIYWRHWYRKKSGNSNNTNNKIVQNRVWRSTQLQPYHLKKHYPTACLLRLLDWKEPLLFGNEDSLFCCTQQWCEMI